MTIIEKIKTEIERRKSELKRYDNDDLIKFRAYDEMLSILSTLASEKSAPADLMVGHNVHEKEVNEMLVKIDEEVLSELSEKPINPDELKKEIEKIWLEYECYNEDYDKVAEMCWNEFEKVARHFYELGCHAGAKWQKEQDEILKVNYEGARTVYDNTVQHLQEKIDEKYELGKKDKKEQMLKEAVNGWLDEDNEPPYDLNVVCEEKIPFGKFKHGDKVKIIIVKEEN